ncbi:MAG TPA: hypothetical protein VNZ49_04995 [Bacteroidia bacterium]|jgi:hypothetical protein|nr:hypothetical protein [Bacteroidia bacterium]
MRKQRNDESLPNWVFWGIILLIVIALYHIFKTDKIKRYKDDLRERINEKEKHVSYLIKELNKLRKLKGDLTSAAVKFFRFIKIILFAFLLGIGVTAYAVFNCGFWDAVEIIATVVAVLTILYYGTTIIVQNKLGNINTTLEILQEYFISKSFKAVRFEPMLIEAYENKLNKEMMELRELKERHYMCLPTNNQLQN